MPSLKFHKFFKLQKYLYSSRKKKEKQATGEFFFPISKACTNKLYISQQCMYNVYRCTKNYTLLSESGNILDINVIL